MKTQSEKKQKKHIRVGDKVKVLSGDQKGLIGNILSIGKKNQMVLLDSTKKREKFLSKREKEKEKEKLAASRPDEPIDTLDINTKKEIPIQIHLSNLMLWDNNANIASRIGYKLIETKKVRYFKKSGNFLLSPENRKKKSNSEDNSKKD
jgi:large subunit ribosomal protein L24